MDKFPHSGYCGTRSKTRVAVENNAMTKDKVKHHFVLPHDAKLNLALQAVARRREMGADMKTRMEARAKIMSSVERLGSASQKIRPGTACTSNVGSRAMFETQSFMGRTGIDSAKTGGSGNNWMYNEEDDYPEPDPFSYENPSDTVVDIRCMLHPGLSRVTRMNYDHWIPGAKGSTKNLGTLAPKKDDSGVFADTMHSNHPKRIKSKMNHYFSSKKNIYDIGTF